LCGIVGAGAADIVQPAGLVIEAEQQVLYRLRAPAPVETADDAVDRPPLLELLHRPPARLVGEVELLGDDAVQPLASQPAPRRRGRAGGLAEAKRRPAGDLADERLQRVAPLGEAAAGQVLAAAGEQI